MSVQPNRFGGAILLGVNIDHVATLRQARGTRFPDPVQAAIEAEQAGADGWTSLPVNFCQNSWWPSSSSAMRRSTSLLEVSLTARASRA